MVHICNMLKEIMVSLLNAICIVYILHTCYIWDSIAPVFEK